MPTKEDIYEKVERIIRVYKLNIHTISFMQKGWKMRLVENGTNNPISPVLTPKEMELWLDGYVEGLKVMPDYRKHAKTLAELAEGLDVNKKLAIHPDFIESYQYIRANS